MGFRLRKKAQLDKMLDSGVIQSLSSDYVLAPVLVRNYVDWKNRQLAVNIRVPQVTSYIFF